MRKFILRAALIPVLFSLVGLYKPKTRPTRTQKFHTLNAKGQADAQTQTRDRVIAARVKLQGPDPNNAGDQVEVTIDPNTHSGRPHKSDQELQDDAKAMEDQLVEIYGPQKRGDITVATGQDANGNLYYTTNGTSTDQMLRLHAEELGYTRMSGSDLREPGKDHAEQQWKNAMAQRQKAADNGELGLEPYSSMPVPPVRWSPSKAPCEDNRGPNDPKNQKCRTDSGTNIVGI